MMKTINVVLAALALTAISTSCSKDDEGNPTGGDLTAKWNEVKTVQKVSGETYTNTYTGNEPGCDKDFVEFNDDGTLDRAIYFKDTDGVCTENGATAVEWQKDGNTLLISDGPYGGTYEIKKLSNSQLTIETEETVGSITTTYIIYFNKAAN